MTWRGKWPPSAAETPCPRRRAKGDRTPMVSCPLLTPLTFLWTRLPAVARLNARGPQGRLVLQGYTLDRSGAFRSGELPLCTGWPRTVMRGKPRKLTSGPKSVPKSARRPEPSPRNSRFAAHLRCVSAKEGLGESRGGKGTIRCPCPLLPLAVGTAYPAGEHRHLRRQTAAMPSLPIGSQSRLHRLRRCIGGRFHDCKSYNYTKSIENDRLRAGDGRLVFYDRRFLKSS